MKIIICSSINFTPKIKEVSHELIKNGHEVNIPLTSQRIINGELTMEEFQKEKQQNGDGAFRKIKDDLIKRHYDLIKVSDAILVINLEKNNINNYIGGNTLIEMGFAYILNKPIYLYNDIPQISYTDELIAMKPIILNGDLSKIQ